MKKKLIMGLGIIALSNFISTPGFSDMTCAQQVSQCEAGYQQIVALPHIDYRVCLQGDIHCFDAIHFCDAHGEKVAARKAEHFFSEIEHHCY